MSRFTQARKRYIEAKDVPLYILKQTGLRVTVRQVCQWIKQGSIQRYYPPAYKLTTKIVFTTRRQVDKFLKRMSDETKFKNTLTGYLQTLFKTTHKL